MADKKESEITSNLVETFQETNRKIAETIVAAQERNIKFAQSTFTSAMEVLKHHMESTRSLMKEFEQQAQKQQEAFQKMVPGATGGAQMPPYMDFFRAPLAAYQNALEATESATKQGMENFQKIIENLQHVSQQSMDEMQKATHRAQSGAKSTKG